MPEKPDSEGGWACPHYVVVDPHISETPVVRYVRDRPANIGEVLGRVPFTAGGARLDGHPHHDMGRVDPHTCHDVVERRRVLHERRDRRCQPAGVNARW